MGISRKLATLCLLLALLLTGGSSAFAAGATTDTFHEHHGTDVTIGDVNPCSGAVGDTTIIYNAVFHITETSNGSLHITGTFTGKFTFVPYDSSQPTYTGHITNWFGVNANSSGVFETTETFHLNLRGSDGSHLRFRGVIHMTIRPDGTIAVDFGRFSECE
jgi:hypothetical protein